MYNPKMEFKKPPHEKLIFTKKLNYEYTGEYLTSKKFESEAAMPFECGDNVERDVRTAYIRATRKLYKHEEMLENQKKNAIERRAALDNEWEDMAQKEQNFRVTFKAFNKFVRENQEKRERAQQKILDMKHLYEETKKNIKSVKSNTLELIEAKKVMDKNITIHRIYEQFLNKVVDAYPQNFTTIRDIIKRYESLVLARNKLQELQERDMLLLEKARTDFMKLIEEKNFIIMGLNNQIANLQARYENANIKSLECEQLVLQIKNSAARQMHEIDEVKSTIWNVYVHMAQSKMHPVKIKKENVEEQMMYVKRTLTELAKVNQILRKQQSKVNNKVNKKK